MGGGVVMNFCFFNDTATTEIYTLTPSFPPRRSSDRRRPLSDAGRTQRRGHVAATRPAGDRQPHLLPEPRRAAGMDRPGHRCRDRRSEEHTSELQSLMRISYAVFCSEKTNLPPTHPPAMKHTHMLCATSRKDKR